MIKGIWLVFAVIFIVLATYHFWQARIKILKIESKAMVKNINGANLGIAEFISDFNNFIDKQNISNREVNLIQGAGYVVASATALFSFFLS